MSWYYIVIEVICWIFVFFMLRHGIYRGTFLLHIFQQNGYKVNEFSIWLYRHWNSILMPVSHLALILITLFGLHYLQSYVTSSAITVILVIFAMFWFGPVSRYRGVNVKKPLVFTARVTRLTIVYIGLAVWVPLIGTIYSFYTGTLYPEIHLLVFSWVFADLLLPYVLILAAGIIYPVELLIQNHYKRQARKKITFMPDLKVIGITGSYGKTSTKFLLDAILKERFRVCTTPGSYNTPMGICKVINNDLQLTDQVLILEMGARYDGNIDELCRIARPNIAVVTNVGIAHLETFGSQDAIARTKEALVKNVTSGGMIVLNGDDPRVRKMAKRDDVETIYAGISPEGNHIFAQNIGYDEQGCSFELRIRETVQNAQFENGKKKGESIGDITRDLAISGRSEVIKMSLLGEHSVQNALLASGVGLMMGVRLPTIKIALRKVKPVEHRLNLKKKNGVLVIDDAFNSNPVGAKNAITVLCSFNTGEKYVVTPGMIELGELQQDENRAFGLWMAEKRPDHIFLVGKRQTRPVYEGLQQGGFDMKHVTITNSLFEANDMLREKLSKGDVVLYENDLPDSYSEGATNG